MKRYELIIAPLIIAFLVLTSLGVPAAAQTPALACNPSSGYLHTSITLTGSGFPTGFGSEALISITWDGTAIQPSYPNPLKIENDGTFTAYLSVPFNAAFGSHIIRASGKFTEGQEEAAETTFTLLAPALVASPTSGFSTVTLECNGFYPQGEGQEIDLVFTWDSVVIPALSWPYSNYTNNSVRTAIISVNTQNSPGNHTIKATQELDGRTLEAEATFRVIDMTGKQGLAGAVGATGATGATGAAGATGAKGAQGIQGIQGPAGYQGASGARGAAGAMGATGPQGPQGPAGVQGMSGSQGQPGPQGPAGNPGPTGPAGPEGPEGKAGAAGLTTGISIIALVVAVGTLGLFVLAKMKKWIFG
jgi:hypothetical protein